jgi:hypothetical protein
VHDTNRVTSAKSLLAIHEAAWRCRNPRGDMPAALVKKRVK